MVLYVETVPVKRQRTVTVVLATAGTAHPSAVTKFAKTLRTALSAQRTVVSAHPCVETKSARTLKIVKTAPVIVVPVKNHQNVAITLAKMEKIVLTAPQTVESAHLSVVTKAVK
jgi:hypothetical protein